MVWLRRSGNSWVCMRRRGWKPLLRRRSEETPELSEVCVWRRGIAGAAGGRGEERVRS